MLARAGASDPVAKIPLVTREARSERTAKLLIARLDALTRAAGRLPRGDAERLVELATVATMRAVALELIEADRAEAIWRAAHRRNPALPAIAVESFEQLAA